MVQDNIKMFLEKYLSDIVETEVFFEYWIRVLGHMYLEELLSMESKSMIEQILLKEDSGFFSTQEILENAKEENIRLLLQIFKESEKQFKEKECVQYDWEKKKLNPKEQEYAKIAYGDIKRYYVLYQIMCPLKHRLQDFFEKRVCYRRYGNFGGLYGGKYCPSAMWDLCVGNLTRGTFFKEKPENLSGKVEYAYDKDGRLVMCKVYKTNESLWTSDFLIYSGDYLMNVCYGIDDQIESLCIRTYKDELISEYEYAHFRVGYNDAYLADFLNKEKYKYDLDGQLKVVSLELYRFPRLTKRNSRSEELIRRELIPQYNEKKHIVSLGIKTLLGNEEIMKDYIISSINKKKQASTAMKCSRWHRPNYFIK